MEEIPPEKIEQEREGAVVVGQIIEQDEQRKHKVIEIYNDIKLFLESIIGDNVEKELTTEFGDIVGEIERHQEELKRDECPIVVAGETSAGKSSLINLILGRDILPQQLLSCTTTICRLRNKNKMAISVTNEKDKTEQIDISTTADESVVRQQLKKFVSRQSDNENYKYVDISLPIPLLKSHTLIIDTPGIGSSPELTSRLLDYLPNAIAFIYVINSSNAGGLQGDRLLKIFENQKDRVRHSKLHEFDTKTAIFVCNKWDQVPPEEEDDVWEFICKELNDNWPNFNPEEQIYKLSVIKEREKQRQGLELTEHFSKLLSGIEKLIPASLEAKVARHTRWQNVIMQKLLRRIVSKIRYSKQTKEEKEKRKTEIEHIVKHLKPSLKQIKSEIIEEANMKCASISKQLHKHLNDPSTTVRLFKFSIHELPNGRYNWFIKERGKDLILNRINSEIRDWCRTECVDNVTEELNELLRNKYQKVESEIEEICNNLNDYQISLEKKYSKDKTLRDRNFLDAYEDTVLSWPFLVVFPLSFAITALLSPILWPLVVKDFFDKSVKDYNDNKQEYMRRWCFQLLKEFSVKNIEKVIHDTYLNDFKKRVTHLSDHVIPKRIEADEKSIDNIIKDIRTSSIIRDQYRPLENRCMVILGKILLVDMEFFSGCKIPEDKIRGDTDTLINNGGHADVFETSICISDQWTKAAVKCLRRPLDDDDDIYIQLAEVQTLRRLRHPNMVELYGISYNIDCDGMKHLKIFMEYCTESLEELVMSKNRPWEPCYKFKSLDKCGRSLEFYIKMMCDVCQGLSYIHKEGFVHRDLKLSNILVKDGTAKIADVGIAKEVESISGTLTGTPSIMAPEVFSKRIYGTEADIYSVGIILWEMWYCRPAYTKVTDPASGNFAYSWKYVSDLQDHVKEGHRPEFDFGYSPPKDLRSLIEKCWDSEINIRPTAEQVLNELTNIRLII